MPDGLFIVLFGYFLGSIPTGLIITKIFSKIDPRKMGSKNIGATNVFRTAGKTLGILTLIGDILKGAIPIGIANQLGSDLEWGFSKDVWIALSGLAPFLGHIFSIFLGFRGGKGVATALGIFLIISPLAVLLEVLIFVGIVWKWRFVSLGSIICSLTMPFLITIFRSDSKAYLILCVIVTALIIYRHRSNIIRLLEGTENHWRLKN